MPTSRADKFRQHEGCADKPLQIRLVRYLVYVSSTRFLASSDSETPADEDDKSAVA